jgi:hypothetical protein
MHDAYDDAKKKKNRQNLIGVLPGAVTETKYANQILACSMYFFINGCKAYDARA